MTKSTRSLWDPAGRILTTELRGEVTAAEVQAWKEAFATALESVPPSSDFGLLYDLHGFDPVDMEAHRLMREVVPLALARHGLRPAFADWFDPAMPDALPAARDCRCVAFANVHHDEVKMARYEQEIAKPNQRFFTEAAGALAWLKTRMDCHGAVDA